MPDKKATLIPPYMKFEYTKSFVKDNGNGRRFHRCIGATFGTLRAYDIRQADFPITEPYRCGDSIIEALTFLQGYPGPYFDFNGCSFSDVLAIDDFAIQYDPDKNAITIHDKPKIKEQLDCSNRLYVQNLSSRVMYFRPVVRLNNVKPRNIMKKGKVDKGTPDYPIFQLIQEMNFDHTPKLTANRFFTPWGWREDCDTSLLFKVSPICYKVISVRFSGMQLHVDRIDLDTKAEPRQRVSVIYENCTEGLQRLETLLQDVKQARDKYVQEQYYIHK